MRLALLATLPGLACKKEEPPAAPVALAPPPPAATAAAPPPVPLPQPELVEGELVTIDFDFDRSELRADQLDELRHNLALLQADPGHSEAAWARNRRDEFVPVDLRVSLAGDGGR